MLKDTFGEGNGNPLQEIPWKEEYGRLQSMGSQKRQTWLVAHLVKNHICNVGDLGLIPGLGRSPEEGTGYLLQYSGLENFHGLYRPWGCKESDRTERLSLSLNNVLKDTFGEGNDNPFQEIPWKEKPGRLQSRVSQKSRTRLSNQTTNIP